MGSDIFVTTTPISVHNERDPSNVKFVYLEGIEQQQKRKKRLLRKIGSRIKDMRHVGRISETAEYKYVQNQGIV